MRIFLQCSYKFKLLILVSIFTINTQFSVAQGKKSVSNTNILQASGGGNGPSSIINVISPLPADLTKCEGDMVVLSISATSDSMLTYIWKKDGVAIANVTPSLTLNNVSQADTGLYEITIKETNSSNQATSTCKLVINKKPVIIAHPTGNTSLCAGDTLNLSAVVNNATMIWRKGSGNLSIGSMYQKANIMKADTGSYSVFCRAMIGCRDTMTSSVMVSVKTGAMITTHPKSTELRNNENLQYIFRVKVSGDGPFGYQWFKDGSIISGANGDTFKIFNFISIIDSGRYQVRVTTPAPCEDTLLSNTAFLTPTICPVFVSQKINGKTIDLSKDTIFVACTGGLLSLEVTAAGANTVQWVKNGINLNGAIYNRYQVIPVTGNEEGFYSLAMRPFDTTLTCQSSQRLTPKFFVKVDPRQKITMQPMANTLCHATTHRMVVAASNTSSYQWYLNDTAIPGATDTVYNVAAVTSSPQLYRVHAINSYCTQEPSNTILVRQIDPIAAVAVKDQSRLSLIEQCTDTAGWSYYSHADNPFEMLFALRKNGNSSKFVPDIKMDLGLLKELKTNEIERKGILMGLRRTFNVRVDTGVVTKPYDVRFFYSNTERNEFLNAVSAIFDVYSYSSNLPINEVSFITSTQKPMDPSLVKAITNPLNFNNTIVNSSKIGKVGVNNFVEIYGLVSSNGGGAMYFDYYNYKNTSAIVSADKTISASLFPNPSAGSVQLSYAEISKKDIELVIFDPMGRTVFHTSLSGKSSSAKLDLSHLSNGSYVVHLSSDLQSIQTKLVIEK